MSGTKRNWRFVLESQGSSIKTIDSYGRYVKELEKWLLKEKIKEV